MFSVPGDSGFCVLSSVSKPFGICEGDIRDIREPNAAGVAVQEFCKLRRRCVTVPEQLSCGIVTAKKPFSQHEWAVTLKERDVLRENEEGT